MKKRLLPILFLTICFAFAQAQENETVWHHLSSTKQLQNDVTLIKSNDKEIVVSLNLNSYGLEKVVTPKGEASIASLFKGASIQQKGAPDLAKFTQSVVVPGQGEMAVEVIKSNFVEIPNIEIAPSRGVMYRNTDPKDVLFEYGKEYSVNSFFPSEIAYLSDPYLIREVRGQVINFQAMQYNPVSKTLRIYTDITVRVYETGNVGINEIERNKASIEVDEVFESVYKNHFLNFNESTKYTPLSESNKKMLIITYDSYASAIQPFVDWKNSIGFQTQVVNYSTIGSSSALKTYVQNYYNNNGLTYLLIVGDHAQVPTSSTSAGDSDNNYGYTSGTDHYLDIFVGRFSAESATQVTTQVNRTLYYERDMASSNAIISKGIGIASNEGAGGGDMGESDEEHMNNIQTDLTGYGYSITKCYQNGGSTSQLSSLINSGTGIINYVGHGSDLSWYAPSFSVSNVNALTNTNKYPFIISVACVVGNFKSQTCFAEAWLRATSGTTPTGGLVFCGSTINQSWQSPMRAQDEMNDLLVANTFKTYGGIFVNGMFEMIDAYGTDGANMADTWTVFGDPSVQTRTPGHPDGPQSGTTCSVPSNLASGSITTTSATVSWGAVTGAQNYTLAYKLQSASTFTETTVTGTSKSLTGLTESSAYEFKVKTNCSSGSSAYSATQTFNTSGSSCGVPTNLTAGSITNTSATISWSAVSGAQNYTFGYKLQSASTYTESTVTGTSKSLTGLTLGTTYDYRVRTNCTSGSSAYATQSFTTTGGVVPYCTSKGNDFSYEWIAGVAVGTFSNNSAGAGYTDFTSKTLTVAAGSNYNVTLTPGFSSSSYSEYWKIWIDLNKDGDFADAGEELFSKNGTAAVTGTISIPAGTVAVNGTRMRVTMKYNAAPTACEASFAYGEVEDYTVNITGTGPDTQAPTTPGNLTVTGTTTSNISISWTASTDNVGVDHYTVTVNGTSSNTTGTSFTASGLSAATTYTLSVKAYDAAGNVSPSASVNGTTLSNDVTYCTAAGGNQSYEWIAGVKIGNITNNSAASPYTDFTSKVITATAGGSLSITLTPGFASTAYNEYWKIWIDFNKDGDFADAGEEVYSGSGSTAKTGTISIPSSLAVNTRVRVMMNYSAITSSCGSFTYGEVEDYTINIARGTRNEIEVEPLSVNIFPNPANSYIEIQNSNNTNLGVVNIYTINGSLMKSMNIEKNHEVINISEFSSGLYFVKVGSEVKKFMKQ